MIIAFQCTLLDTTLQDDLSLTRIVLPQNDRVGVLNFSLVRELKSLSRLCSYVQQQVVCILVVTVIFVPKRTAENAVRRHA